MSLLFHVIFLLFLFLPSQSIPSSLTFELPYGNRKCLSEDFPPRTSVRGTVHVSSGTGEMSLDLFVSDQRGVVQFHKSNVNSVKFSFTTGVYEEHTRQVYRFCVVNQVNANAAQPRDKDVARRVTLEVEEVVGEKASEGLAKQVQMDKVYQSFLTVSSEVNGVIEKMEELRAKEQKLSELNEITSAVILRISIVASLVTVMTGVVNFVSLKRFFKRKKLA